MSSSLRASVRGSVKSLTSTDDALTRKKKPKHVKLIPSSVKIEMAIRELTETKRKQTVGQKWNSAAIFSVMWSCYCFGILVYLAIDRRACDYWIFFFLLRVLLLGPTYYLAYLWRIGWWPSTFMEPEWVGVYIATYITILAVTAFAWSLNETCGREIPVAKDTIWIELSDANSLFKLRRGDCQVFTASESNGDYDVLSGGCSAKLVDRRTHFEKNVYQLAGQVILYLFGFTSLFKPSFRATIVFTGNTFIVSALGCWYQGFGFWNDRDRVYTSGVFTAIFLFLCACAVNIFSANVLHKMEHDLVHANYELTANMEKRQRQPSGDKVVYLETDLQSSTKLWEHHTDVMHKAIKVHHNLMRSLALEYFGWELATEGDAFLLAFHDVYDAVSFALTFQNELMDQEWPSELLEDEDALLEFAKLGPDERENLEKIRRGNSIYRKTADGGVETLAFQGLRVRMAIHMGSSEGGIKGPTCRFVHHLTDLSWGGMILLSAPVAESLAGVLDQLGLSAATAKEAAQVPKMVYMGIHTFEDYLEPMEMFHIFNEPLRGRHVMWDARGLRLRESKQHALGFYDAPITREGLSQVAVIVFANIESMETIKKVGGGPAFTEAVLEVHACMGPLLLKHGGYNILPQREGYFMFAFRSPVDVAAFHRDFQAALLKVVWPVKYRELPQTKAVFGDPNKQRDLLYNGLTLSLGMSVGVVNKNLVQARAQFTGRE
mmetsp:Transcript_39544/g.88481  ORF Transcript_39544/g.88481 Transcript_39544/m.88481 type:complete len:718 (-) Transcript_39544:152-2305(-)